MATKLITHTTLHLKTQLGTLNKFIVYPRGRRKKRVLFSMFNHNIPLILQHSSKSSFQHH